MIEDIPDSDPILEDITESHSSEIPLLFTTEEQTPVVIEEQSPVQTSSEESQEEISQEVSQENNQKKSRSKLAPKISKHKRSTTNSNGNDSSQVISNPS